MAKRARNKLIVTRHTSRINNYCFCASFHRVLETKNAKCPLTDSPQAYACIYPPSVRVKLKTEADLKTFFYGASCLTDLFDTLNFGVELQYLEITLLNVKILIKKNIADKLFQMLLILSKLIWKFS